MANKYLSSFFVLLIVIGCFTSKVVAQQPSNLVDVPLFGLTNYTTEDGLPSNEVYSFAFDKNGFLWVATDNGLCRFDSESFDVISKKEGLPDNVILKIKSTPSGAISGYTLGNKAFILDSNFSINTLPIDVDLKDHTEKFKILNWHARDSSNYEFVICNWTPWDNKALPYLISYGKQNAKIKIESFHDNGFNFLLSKNHPEKNWVFNPSSLPLEYLPTNQFGFKFLSFKNFSVPNGYHDFRDFKRSESEQISSTQWAVSVNNHLFLLDSLNNRITTIETFDADINCLEYIDNQLYVGLNHKKGLVTISKIASTSRTFQRSLINLSVSDLLSDNQNNLWIGTLENGIYFKVNSPFSPVNLSDDNITHLRQEENRLFGIKDKRWAGEILYEGSEWKFNPIYCAEENQEINEFWCNANSSCYSSEGIKNQVLEIINSKVSKSVGSLRSASLIPLKNGFFISQAPYGWRILNFNESPPIISKSLNSRIRVFDILNLNDSNFLVGTINGVIKCNLNNDREPFLPNILSENLRVNCITKHNGNLIFGTNTAGIFIIDSHDSLFQKIYPKEHFLSDCITDIVVIDEFVWVSTKKGLACFKTINSTSKYSLIKKYNKQFGLPNESVQEIYSLDSILLLNTPVGLFSLALDKKQIISTSKIFEKYVMVNGKESKTLNNAVLEPHLDDITISFSNLHYGIKQIDCWYRLVGQDSVWKRTKDRVLHFNDLKPGKYSIQISSKPKFISHQTLNYTFELKQKFTESFYFIILISLLILGISFLIFFLLYNRLKLRNNLALSQQTTMISQMNPHFIFNALGSIQHQLTPENSIAFDSISKFARLIRRVLDSSSRGVVSLQEEIEILRNYLELEQTRFTSEFNFELTINNSTDYTNEIIEIPSMLIQPFLENAIIHGLMPSKETNKSLDVTFVIDDKGISVTIKDNGIGINTSIYNKSTVGSISKRRSIGIKNTLERIDLLNRIEKRRITYSINELKEGGTKVELRLDYKIVPVSYQ